MVDEEQPCACALVTNVIAHEKESRKKEQTLQTLKKRIATATSKQKKILEQKIAKVQDEIAVLRAAKLSGTNHLNTFVEECTHES